MTLEEYMRANGLSDRAMGRLVGVSHSIITRYRSGQLRPSWDVMDEIIRVTDGAVQPNDFSTRHPWQVLAAAEGASPQPPAPDPDDEIDAVVRAQVAGTV